MLILPPIVIPALAAGASALGTWMQNRGNRKQAREQMAFQERMSNTSYQRATEDMKLAGLNPMLAFQQGGASSPGGAQATMQDAIGPAVSSAQHARRLAKELKNLDAQGVNIQANTQDTYAARAQKNEDTQLKRDQRAYFRKMTTQIQQQIEINRSAVWRSRNDEAAERSRLGRAGAYGRTISSIFSGVPLGLARMKR